MYCPPFAVSVEPAMRPASPEARKTTQRPISSPSPSRPMGMVGRMLFSNTSLGTGKAATSTIPIVMAIPSGLYAITNEVIE